jgi:predicted protein tyrosine phosphatase
MTDSPEPPADSSDGFDPVVVQVGSRALYLGDRAAADPACHDHTFEAVVSLTLHSRPLTTHHHPLHDGPATEFEEFAAAVDATRDVFGDSRDDVVLVHCAAGISRSSTVITTAVAAEEQRSFNDVLAELETYRKRARPHPALRALAREYLGEEPTATEADARDSDTGRHSSLIDRLEAKTVDETDDGDSANADTAPDNGLPR